MWSSTAGGKGGFSGVNFCFFVGSADIYQTSTRVAVNYHNMNRSHGHVYKCRCVWVSTCAQYSTKRYIYKHPTNVKAAIVTQSKCLNTMEFLNWNWDEIVRICRRKRYQNNHSTTVFHVLQKNFKCLHRFVNLILLPNGTNDPWRSSCPLPQRLYTRQRVYKNAQFRTARIYAAPLSLPVRGLEMYGGLFVQFVQ